MGDGHEFDLGREIFDQLATHNAMLSRALVAERLVERAEALIRELRPLCVERPDLDADIAGFLIEAHRQEARAALSKARGES